MNKIIPFVLSLLILSFIVPASPAQAQEGEWQLSEKRIELPDEAPSWTGRLSAKVTDTSISVFNEVIPIGETEVAYTINTDFTFSDLPETLTPGETITIDVSGGPVRVELTGTKVYDEGQLMRNISPEISISLFLKKGLEPEGERIWPGGETQVKFEISAASETPSSKSFSFTVPETVPQGEIHLYILYYGKCGIYRVYRGGSATEAGIAPDTDVDGQQERLERAITQNLVDYIYMNQKFLEELQPLYSRADYLMEDLRDAQWFLSHGTDEDREQAEADILRLQDEMEDLLGEFNDRATTLEEVLDGIETQFVQYKQKQELTETLKGFRSQMNLTRINLVLRSGNVEEFDTLFQQYRGDENIADKVLVSNAFRRLMAGDTRTALESVKQALDRNAENPTAQQLRRDLEIYYLDAIRDKLAGEQSQSSRLFNQKLNGHGQEGVGSFLLDVLTTGAGESFQALAAYIETYNDGGVTGLAQAGYQALAEGRHPKGYYDFLQEVSSLNIDEATAQTAGIHFVKDLRQHGITFGEISEMTVPRLQEIIMEEFDGRVLSEEQATILRKRIWDAFKNPDVDALRRGEKTQLDVDVGRDYFDTEVLEQGASDIIMSQFSAWDTFLTFAPSAQLGKVSKLGVCQRLGLTAETTFQQGLQKGLRIEELGHRLYQTRGGAAVIDATYQWNAYTEMVSQAVKKRIGEVAYASGSITVQTLLSQMSAPAQNALKKEILEISDYYLGSGGTATVEATVNTMSSFFNFVGLNSQALQRGAYGVENLENAKDKIQAELTRRKALASNAGIAQVSSRPVDFDDFEAQVTAGGNAYLQGIRDARDKVKGAAQGLSGRRSLITTQADEALEQMEEAALALQGGDSTRARQIFASMQSVTGRNFDFADSQNLRKLGGATDTMRMINLLESKPPADVDIAAAVTQQALKFTSAPKPKAAGESTRLDDILTNARLQVISK